MPSDVIELATPIVMTEDTELLPTPNNAKVLVIGWDAADWRMIRPLIEQGKMPNLRQMMDQGVHGNISTLLPILSPMIWTSIATGKRADKHGIWGFSEPTPDGKSIRPITNTNRKCKAVWNLLNQAGKKCNVVAFWPSHPAEPINGVMVSNWYQNARPIKGWKGDPETEKPQTGPAGWTRRQWAMPPGTVHPQDFSDRLQEFRFHPAELEAEHVAPFIPNFAELQKKRDPRLLSFAKILADTVSVHGAATALMQLEPWDFMAVYYDGIDHFGHGFMKYNPPRSPWISEEDFENFHGVVEGGYRFHDMMLGNLLQLAGEDTTVLLLSDHGFHPDHLRPSHIPEEPAGPSVEHRPYGIFVAKGPGIRQGETVAGASVLDLTPTVLHIFGLPVGEDMDGKVLLPIFEHPTEIRRVDSWEGIEGPHPDGTHPRDAQLDSLQSQEVMKQLIELGYIEDPGDDMAEAVSESVRELSYNLAQAHMDAGHFADALHLLEGIWADWPREHRFGTTLIACLGALARWPERALAIEKLEENVAAGAVWARAELQTLAPELTRYGVKLPGVADARTGGPRDEDADSPPSASSTSGAKTPAEPEEMPKPLARKLRKLQALQRPMDATLEWLRVEQALHAGHLDEARAGLDRLGRVETANPSPQWLSALGSAYLATDAVREARAWFERALAMDPESLEGHRGLAEVAAHDEDWSETVNRSLAASELRFLDPRSHYLLGRGLEGMGDRPMARTAYETAVRQAPGFLQAREALATLLEALGETAAAAEQRTVIEASGKGSSDNEDLDALAEAIRRTRGERRAAAGNARVAAEVGGGGDIVTIVSGLPRSGTSMMMQMLVAGGLRAYADAQREADEDNPRGYYEHANAKRLMVDAAWVPEARGRVVKIVAQLLQHLPKGERYRIVFMDRDPQSVVRSQHAMLERGGGEGARLDTAALMGAFDAQLAQVERLLARRSDMDAIFVDYDDAVADPPGTARHVADWLGMPLDPVAMADAVDCRLRHQRAAVAGKATGS